MYTTFIRLLQEYCDLIWDNATADSEKKQKKKKRHGAIDKEAGTIIKGTTNLLSIVLLLSYPVREYLQE